MAKKMWFVNLTATLSREVEEETAKEVLLDALRRKADVLTLDEIALGTCEQGAKLIVERPDA